MRIDFRERIAGDVDHVPDQLLGIDPRAPAFGPAREREDLLDQLRPVPRVVLDHPDQVAAFLIPFLHSQHFARDENGRQHVIEIVRDASRQRADALQPLRAQKLLFQLLSFRHVLHHADRVLHPAIRTSHRRYRQPRVNDFPSLAQVALLELVVFPFPINHFLMQRQR